MNDSTPLLADDGSPSMATLFLMAHHGLRRDLGRFAKVLRGRPSPALVEEWSFYHLALHGHHVMEDTTIFPGMVQQHPEMKDIFAGLMAEHHRIDPILERSDAAFARLDAGTAGAAAVVAELSEILHPHLQREEPHVVPLLRKVPTFAMPGDSEEILGQMAQGFAWTSFGVHPDVLAKAYSILPERLVSRIPAARAAYEARCVRAFGSAETGLSRTSVPAPIG